MVRLNILALRCPECSGELRGLETDVVFYCPSCRSAWEFHEDKFAHRPVTVVKPRRGEVGIASLYLPFWLFDISTTVNTTEDKREKAAQYISQFHYVWVCGFRMWRSSYFGNPGFLYTSNKLSVEQDAETENEQGNGPLPVLIGAGLGSKQAADWVKPILLSILDRHIDVACIDLSGDIHSTRLIAVPFRVDGEKIIDTQIDWKYPARLFEDLPYILDSGK